MLLGFLSTLVHPVPKDNHYYLCLSNDALVNTYTSLVSLTNICLSRSGNLSCPLSIIEWKAVIPLLIQLLKLVSSWFGSNSVSYTHHLIILNVSFNPYSSRTEFQTLSWHFIPRFCTPLTNLDRSLLANTAWIGGSWIRDHSVSFHLAWYSGLHRFNKGLIWATQKSDLVPPSLILLWKLWGFKPDSWLFSLPDEPGDNLVPLRKLYSTDFYRKSQQHMSNKLEQATLLYSEG